MTALYRRVFVIGLQDTFVYRWNFLLRSLFSVIPLVGTVFVWKSVCGSEGMVSDYSLASVISYFVGVLLVDNLASPTEDEWRIAAEIREGQISSLLTKPLNHLLYRLTLFSAYRLLYSAITLPVLGAVLWALSGHLHWPSQPSTWIFFFLSVCGSALIQFFIAYALAMLAFWILEVSTLIFILYSFEYFFSGHVFPLDLLPAGLRAILEWTPFPYELFFPVQILLERLEPEALHRGFAMQCLWVAITAGCARFLWNRGVNHYQAVGG
jgi:ABC-2 type transport system permease protein